MTEEKKSAIRKRIALAELLLAAVLLGYLVYGLVTKNSDQTVFRVMAVILVAVCVVLNDLVEPYLTEVFVNMDSFRKNAYRNYVLCDVASMAGILVFALTFSEEGSMIPFIGLLIYFVGNKQKQNCRGAYLGEVTKDDVEAAKAAVCDVEAKEITEEESEE